MLRAATQGPGAAAKALQAGKWPWCLPGPALAGAASLLVMPWLLPLGLVWLLQAMCLGVLLGWGSPAAMAKLPGSQVAGWFRCHGVQVPRGTSLAAGPPRSGHPKEEAAIR